MGNFNYSNGSFPNGLRCGKCQCTGVKLWREYNVAYTDILCRACVSADQGAHKFYGEDTVCGWYIACVPKANNPSEFWSFSTAPEDAMNWWFNLPG